MKKNKGIIVLHEEFGKPEENNKLWSTFAELELLVEGIEKFVYICVNFTPSSIEILEPKELTFTDKNMTDWLNELLSLMHEIGMNYKETKINNELYLKSMNALVRNCVLLALEKPLAARDLSKKTGVDEKTLTPFLEAMEKEKRIHKQGALYAKK
ncbi:hypothetical protein C4573_04720 [Candidatus Woesearchaeota archaeon]|nr:MAG: hypothetical protein C4573_04720 [Candidatus Woesearchaeota archaeon]